MTNDLPKSITSNKSAQKVARNAFAKLILAAAQYDIASFAWDKAYPDWEKAYADWVRACTEDKIHKLVAECENGVCATHTATAKTITTKLEMANVRCDAADISSSTAWAAYEKACADWDEAYDSAEKHNVLTEFRRMEKYSARAAALAFPALYKAREDARFNRKPADQLCFKASRKLEKALAKPETKANLRKVMVAAIELQTAAADLQNTRNQYLIVDRRWKKTVAKLALNKVRGRRSRQ